MKRREILIFISGIVLGAVAIGAFAPMKGAPSIPLGRIWGYPYVGIAVSVQPKKVQYTLGEKIEVTTYAKNVGTRSVPLVMDGSEHLLALYTANGHPVPMTSAGEVTSALFGKKREARRRVVLTLSPGKEIEQRLFVLNNWFNITKAGTYYLVVMREVERGFAVSNLARISIR
ncbi:MAG: hypothetical protein ACYC7E_10695 [Armatimonadota bacterium]